MMIYKYIFMFWHAENEEFMVKRYRVADAKNNYTLKVSPLYLCWCNYVYM